MAAGNALSEKLAADSELVIDIENCTTELQDVVLEIDQIFSDAQIAGLTAFWRIGQLINRVKNFPETYLTAEQRAAHVDGASLIISIFAPVYTADQLRSAVNFFDRYPTENEIHRLLSLRCPDRPRWRMTLSHVQLLSQIADDDTRASLEDACANEAYTARSLALELQELRGKQKNSGRTHQAPKGLKQQLHDLLQHQKRFIARSEQLWLNDDTDTDSVYDALANTPPEKIDEAMRDNFAEICGNFTIMSDLLGDHISTCNRVAEMLQAQSGEILDAESEAVPKQDSPLVR
jgi:hypothetical protein